MGLFFSRTQTSHQALTDKLTGALMAPPPANQQAAQAQAAQLANQVQPARTLNPISALIALLFLVVLGVSSYLTAGNTDYADMHKALLNCFEVMLGLVPGAILGEAAGGSS